MQFFDIHTFKSGPNPSFFKRFELKICFAPQRRAIFNRTRKATFRPSRPTNHCKNTAFRDFPNISCTCIFFLLLFLFLSSTSLLCLSSLHIVGSLTSKLPLITVESHITHIIKDFFVVTSGGSLHCQVGLISRIKSSTTFTQTSQKQLPPRSQRKHQLRFCPKTCVLLMCFDSKVS